LAEDALIHYARFDDIVELIRAHRDVKLLVEVETGVRLVNYQPGRIEFAPTDNAPRDLAQRLGARLQAWTGNRWAISITDGDAPTIAEVRDAKENAIKAEAQEHPLVQAVIAAFPKAKITEIRTETDKEREAFEGSLPEVDEEWDPFDEE
jgi:DNA polymerase-3 subunit gamma/tau